MSLKDLSKLVRNLTEEKSIEEQFLFDLNETMARFPSSYKPSKTFKPSSMGGCKRRIYYQIIGAPMDESKESPTLVGINESGSARHEHIQMWIARMKQLGYDCEWIDVSEFLRSRPVNGTRVIHKQGMETKCFNDILNMSFLCDGVIRYKGKYYILEIKTEASHKFNGQTEAYAAHIKQATCYSICLGIDTILFLYEDRNYCTKKTFLVDITEEMKQRILDIVFEVENHLQSKTCPKRSTEKGDCTYCDYATQCQKDGE